MLIGMLQNEANKKTDPPCIFPQIILLLDHLSINGTKANLGDIWVGYIYETTFAGKCTHKFAGRTVKISLIIFLFIGNGVQLLNVCSLHMI